MTLHLVIHRPEPQADAEADGLIRTALRDAVWEVAESHWSPGGEALLVASDLSPDYLLSHFRRAMARRGFADPGLLLVVQIGDRAAFAGLPADAAAWADGVV